MSALRKMTSFLGYVEPAEDAYEQVDEAVGEPYAEETYEQ